MSQHTGSPSLGAEVSYFAEARISVNSTEGLCLYMEMYMLGSPLEHFQTSCKNGTGDKHLSNILGKSLLRTEGKPEQKSYEWEDLMRDKG